MASVLDFEKEIDSIFDKEQSDFKELKKEYLSALITTLENYEKISKNLENKDYEKIDLNIKDFLKKINVLISNSKFLELETKLRLSGRM